MLTMRGWRLLLTIVAMLVLGLLGITGLASDAPFRLNDQPHITIVLLSLTFGLWFAAEWFMFALRCQLLRRRLTLMRELRDERGAIATLWAKRTFRVRVVLQLRGRLRIPFVRISDLLPAGAVRGEGFVHYEGALEPGDGVTLEYTLQSQTIGHLRFEGLRVQIADVHGFFYHTLFVRDGVEYR